MSRPATIALTALVLIATTAHSQNPDPAKKGQGIEVPLYDNLGSHHHKITTSNPIAQQYFDQGLRLLYAFNHAESANSFREAERLDPSCAMCPWGVALALGPNINAPMDSASGVMAYAAAGRAVTLAQNATDSEQMFIRAMSERYLAIPQPNRASQDSAYAGGMKALADKHLNDYDAQVLYADALMNLSPWNYWERDGTARPGTRDLVSRLERVMDEDPNNPGACHLFIHAEEAHDPTRAVDCAERLAALMPGAGHIVHMPGHVYIRVGRYNDAIEVNKHAAHADESYLEGPHVSRRGIYPQGYYPHNYHFMSFAASMAGDGETAIYAARQVAETVSSEVAREAEWLEALTPIVFSTLVTFGQWDQILAEPLPPSDLRYTTGHAYYARGIALAAKSRWDKAGAALDSVATIAQAFPKGQNKIALQIAQKALAGEIALRQGDASVAVERFREAVELEDGLVYNEPPTWYYPMRQSLSKALLAADKPSDAERIYREDLDRFPANGWSLFGLYQSLEAQGKSDEAAKVQDQFERAWQHADVELTASRF